MAITQVGFERSKKYPSYKKGGTVKKTGLALVHKGEKVIPKGKKGDMKCPSCGQWM